MRPIATDETTGIYQAPNGLEAVVGGLPYWRERDEDGLPVIRSVWALDADEKEAIALGGNVLLGIVGEPIPPVSLAVLSPIDVPAFGMPALDPELARPDEIELPEGYQPGDPLLLRRSAEVPGGWEAARLAAIERPGMYESSDDAAAALMWLVVLGIAVILAILAIGFFLGRVTA